MASKQTPPHIFAGGEIVDHRELIGPTDGPGLATPHQPTSQEAPVVDGVPAGAHRASDCDNLYNAADWRAKACNIFFFPTRRCRRHHSSGRRPVGYVVGWLDVAVVVDVSPDLRGRGVETSSGSSVPRYTHTSVPASPQPVAGQTQPHPFARALVGRMFTSATVGLSRCCPLLSHAHAARQMHNYYYAMYCSLVKILEVCIYLGARIPVHIGTVCALLYK